MYKRVAKLFFMLCLFFGVLLARIVLIDISEDTSAVNTNNNLSFSADKSRGTVYDCNMQPLVNTEKETYIAVKPTVSALSELSGVISQDEQKALYGQISDKKIGVIKTDKNYSSESAITFSLLKRYEDDGLCVHLIGYTDYDSQGVCGIEKYYNTLLNENSGELRIICPVDAKGNVLAGGEISVQSSNYGSYAGVVLTIDKQIQSVCEEALKKYAIEKGAVVVLDVKTSQIKAMASVPEFSQNSPQESLNDENAPFINRAITPYSVGSVFKSIVAAAALENNVTDEKSYLCNGSVEIGAVNFGCHEKSGHGSLNMAQAMAVSCNPYFINLAIEVGKESICTLSENLGLGKEIELCDGWYTQSGIMPTAESIVSSQDLANIAFGQGKILASPLQMTAVYAAIANGGIYRSPSLMCSIVDRNRIEYMKAELPASRRVMSDQTAKKVGELLYYAVENGSAIKAKPDNINIAGKTATAQSGQFDENGNEIIQSWFCGYFPYENPKYAVTVFKENGTGGTVDCAPVFKYIAENIA